MRYLLLLLVGCVPDIPSGAYLCGTDGACPEGQICDGPTNSCVAPSAATAFVCDPAVQHDDDTKATGVSLGTPDCVSPPVSADGCLDITDAQDWFVVASPASCTTVVLHVKAVFPVAFAALQLAVQDERGDEVGNAYNNSCPDLASGDDGSCVDIGMHPGESYGILIRPIAYSPCYGDCIDNRYALSVRLSTN